MYSHLQPQSQRHRDDEHGRVIANVNAGGAGPAFGSLGARPSMQSEMGMCGCTVGGEECKYLSILFIATPISLIIMAIMIGMHFVELPYPGGLFQLLSDSLRNDGSTEKVVATVGRWLLLPFGVLGFYMNFYKKGNDKEQGGRATRAPTEADDSDDDNFDVAYCCSGAGKKITLPYFLVNNALIIIFDMIILPLLTLSVPSAVLIIFLMFVFATIFYAGMLACDMNQSKADGLHSWKDATSEIEAENIFQDISKPLIRAFAVFFAQALLAWHLKDGLQGTDKVVMDADKWKYWVSAMVIQVLASAQMGSSFLQELQFWKSVCKPSSAMWRKDEHSKWEKLDAMYYQVARLVLSLISNQAIYYMIIFFLPIQLMMSDTPLDFVKDTFAITFIVSLDDLADKKRFQLQRTDFGNIAQWMNYFNKRSGQEQSWPVVHHYTKRGIKYVRLLITNSRTGDCKLIDEEAQNLQPIMPLGGNGP